MKKRFLPLLASSALTFSLGTSHAAELLALYEFNEADAASFADTTTKTTPTILDGVTADAAGGRDGTGAANFDGFGTGLTIPVDINPAVLPNATIGAWVKLNEFAATANNAPWGHDDGGWDRGVSTTTDVATPSNVWGASDGNFFPSANINTPDLWQFVAVVYRNETVNLHVDDNLVYSFPGNFSFGGQPGSDGVSTHVDLAVGSLNPGAVVHAFNGHIDNFFVYDDAITATQLAAIRDTGPSAAAPTLDPPADTRILRQRWNFESGDLTGWTPVDPLIGDNLVFDSIDGGQPALTANTDNADIGTTAEGNFHIRTWDGQAGTIGLADGPTGVLESDPFVLGANANFEFLVGGGGHHFYGDPDLIEFDITAFNLERQVAPDDWEAIFTASGVGARGNSNGNYFRNGFWDASEFAGETVRFRIYDTHSGGWGHIDVDNIRYTITADISDPTDTDNDNMGDAWETVFFGDLSRDGTGDFEDPDDGLTDAEEFAAGTLPNDPDSDGDTLTDGDEVKVHMTDPLDKDSDDDGFDDNVEIASGTNPNDVNDIPVRTPRRVWNFESGDLTGWTAIDPLIGDNLVFDPNEGGQPAVNLNSDNPNIASGAEGNFHIRTWDGQAGTLGLSDAHTGVIESESFVLEPTAQFELLVGGGNHQFVGDPDLIEFDMTAVTLERQLAPDDWEAIFTASGQNANEWREVTWDAKDYVGETVRLRIYDTHEGGWGHIDADNIRYSIVFNIKDPNQPDDDGDGIGDDWETFYFGNTTTATATTDTDGDGLNDVGEFTACTDPNSKDSDNDGLEDGAEITATSDPLLADTDGDGLNDGAEVNTHGTSPIKADSDDDTWDDPTELAFGTNPNNGALFPIPPADLWSVDIQAVDGPVFAPNEPVLMDGLEATAAAASTGMTSFAWNAFNVQGHDLTQLDPSMQLVNAAGNATGVTFTVFGNISGWTNPENPAQPITNDYLFVSAGNADALADWEISGLTPGATYDFYPYGGIGRDMLLSVDLNGNGDFLDDVPELVPGAGFLFEDVIAGADGKIVGSMESGSNGEANWGGFQLLATGGGPPPIDLDGDGLSDAEEDVLGTDRFNPDTDGDGQSDGAEIKAAGTDPLDPNSNLRIGTVSVVGDNVEITWEAVAGKTYILQVATDLKSWTTLGTYPFVGTTMTVTAETITPGQPEKQYRLLVSE